MSYQPFQYAPYHTSHIVSGDDFKTTSEVSFTRLNSADLNRVTHFTNYHRRLNQASTTKLDPPFKLWLTEKEAHRRDIIKKKFGTRGLAVRPTSHIVTKKEREMRQQQQSESLPQLPKIQKAGGTQASVPSLVAKKP